ncbi:root hair defective 3 gtp-binding protein (rhd3) protein [Cryptosporidium felis]|nr:root hair defective 3 gtp-binding protein (rhd3) protein [Cryptosporidium felis]
MESPLLVWDVEGTDSLERGEDRATFENRAALFSLAVSDCMILNIPLMNLTTYSSSNFGLLKTILNSWFSLKLDRNGAHRGDFGRTTLIFAVRDITINDNDEMLTKKVVQILELLWKQVTEFQVSLGNRIPASFSEIFEVKVYGIPSLPNDKAGFDLVIEKVRTELASTTLPSNYTKNIPLEGLETYCKTVWDCIVNCQELNIPSQIKLVSRFRCEQTKDNILDRLRPPLKDVQRKMERSEFSFDGFSDSTFFLLNQGLNDYFEVASKYDHEVSLQISISLTIFLLQEFQASVNSRMALERQTLREYKDILDFVTRDLDADKFRSEEGPNLAFDSSSWVKKELYKFDSLSIKWRTELPILLSKQNLLDTIREKCIPEILDGISENQVRSYSTTYNTNEQRKLLNETLDIYSKKIHEKLVEEFFKSLIKDILKELSGFSLEHLLADPKLSVGEFWRSIGSALEKAHKMLVAKYRSHWQSLFDSSLSDLSFSDLEEEIALQLLIKFVQLLQQQSKYFHVNIIERFKREFEYDQDGIPRQWIGEDATNMKELFLKAKSNSLSITGIFKPKIEELCPFNSKFNNIFNRLIEGSKDLFVLTAQEEADCHFNQKEIVFLISEGSYQEIESKASQEIAGIFSKAQLIQSTGRQPQHIPWWIYLLIIILGFDEITYLFTSPILIALLLVASSFIYSYMTGNLTFLLKYSQQIVLLSSKTLHFITGIIHNSLDSKK